MKWIQRQTGETMDDQGLRDYIGESHRLIAVKLTKATRKQLGFPV